MVTGLGVVAPNANGKEAFAHALREGKSGIRFHPPAARRRSPLPGRRHPRRHRGASDEVPHRRGGACHEREHDARGDRGDRRVARRRTARPRPDSDEVDWDSGAIIGTGFGRLDTIGEKLVPGTSTRASVRRLGSTLLEQAMISGNSARVGGLLALGNHVSTNSSACAPATTPSSRPYYRIREGARSACSRAGRRGNSKYAWAGARRDEGPLPHAQRRAREGVAPDERERRAASCPSSGAGILLLESLSVGARSAGRASTPRSWRVRELRRAAHGRQHVGPEPRGRAPLHPRRGRDGGHSAPRRSTPSTGTSPRRSPTPTRSRTGARRLGLPPAKMPLIHATKSLIGHALGAAGGIECVAVRARARPRVSSTGRSTARTCTRTLAAYAERIPHVDRRHAGPEGHRQGQLRLRRRQRLHPLSQVRELI